MKLKCCELSGLEIQIKGGKKRINVKFLTAKRACSCFFFFNVPRNISNNYGFWIPVTTCKSLM